MKDIINYEQYKRTANILFLIALLYFIFSLFPYVGLIETIKLNRYILPILWTLMAILILYVIPRVHSIVKVNKKHVLVLDAVLCAIGIISAQIASGLFLYGFGESPYDHSIKGVISNVITIGVMLAGQELVRGYYLGAKCSKPNKRAIIGITVLMILIDVNFNSLMIVTDAKSLLIYFSTEIGPCVCRQMLLSCLALYGGAAASFTYVAAIEAYQKIFPILPNIDWFAEGCIGIVIPLFAIIIIMSKYERSTFYKTKKPKKKENMAVVVVETIFTIVFIWFIVGVFPIFPSVIVTGSMMPLIDPGDIILIEKIHDEEDIIQLKKGDIIQFSRDEILITHRIEEVQEDKVGNLTFCTKGDNNSTKDVRLVLPNEVKGTLQKVVPKLGLLKLFIIGGEDTPNDVEN